VGGISKEVRLSQLQTDAERCGPEALALFKRLVKQGTSPEAAAMYACQQAPGTKNTDRAFCQGQRRKMEGMGQLAGGMLHRAARKAGINTQGKFYMSGLGKATDPHAWVATADDVLTVAKKRNLNVEGVVNHKAIVKDYVPPERNVAPDIVRNIEKQMLRKDPGLRERVAKSKHARKELREAIVDKHARRKHARQSKIIT
jgi:hypothetical protein